MKDKLMKINQSNLPTRIPLTATLVWVMFLDYVSSPQWVNGIIFFLISVFWVVAIYELFTAERVDIFKTK